MSEQPLVSIIVPAYNPGRFLDQALESITAQTYKNIEIIVVDDGSEPPCILESAFRSTVHYYQQNHLGAAQARNFGFIQSRGSFISFRDADDLCEPQKIEKQLSMLLNYPSLGFVMTQIRNFLEPGVSIPQWFKEESKREVRQGFIGSSLIRREVFKKVGFFDSRFHIGEDLDWLIRAQDMGIQSETIQEPLILRRVHEHNTSADIKLGHMNLMTILRESLNRKKSLQARR